MAYILLLLKMFAIQGVFDSLSILEKKYFACSCIWINTDIH